MVGVLSAVILVIHLVLLVQFLAAYAKSRRNVRQIYFGVFANFLPLLGIFANLGEIAPAARLAILTVIAAVGFELARRRVITGLTQALESK